MESKVYPKGILKTEVKPAPKTYPAATLSSSAVTEDMVAALSPKPEPKPEPKPVGPKLDDATLEHCAEVAESYISRGTTQHTPRDLLAYEIAAAIRAKKVGK